MCGPGSPRALDPRRMMRSHVDFMEKGMQLMSPLQHCGARAASLFLESLCKPAAMRSGKKEDLVTVDTARDGD